MKKTKQILATLMLTLGVTACGAETTLQGTAQNMTVPETTLSQAQPLTNTQTGTIVAAQTDSGSFTERDLAQEADLTGAVYETVTDGGALSVTKDGVYVLSGSAKDYTVTVEAGDEDKVQIVLDGVTITNTDFPAIYVKNADKVFLTTTDSENSLSVTGTFRADGDTNTDAVIFSRDDVILNGTGTLTVNSTGNGISSKDEIKMTGGTLAIECTGDGLEANESIQMADGSLSIRSYKDGMHAEYDEDNSTGFIVISGGVLEIAAADDSIHATTYVQIDGGTMALAGAECIEGTYIQINDGSINMAASDDGINAANKSSSYYPTVEINGGSLTIQMGQGDTDAVDSNGDLMINGGTLDIWAQSPFDYDGNASYNGGTVIVNGQEVSSLQNQQMGGGRGGRW
ncbi:MAG: carbohydrate-binding domain-containing protein [Lachnospiraceae bacterium]|nr:carbohydrate-binding domain-containing protein [Lachnospiraceae bacterium]